MNAIDLIGFDLIVNLSGYSLPCASAEMIKATVEDPSGRNERDYRQVRDRIEDIVQSLIAHLRDARLTTQPRFEAPIVGNHVRAGATRALAA